MLAHLVSAALNVVLLVFKPLVLNTGPLPDVFGAGTSTPSSRMHAANLVSAALAAGLAKLDPLPRLKWPPPACNPPHFLIAASYFSLFTPFASWRPPAPAPPSKPPAPAPPGPP